MFMKKEELKDIFMATAFIFTSIMVFFTGIAVRDDIMTHGTAQDIAVVFSFLTSITIITYVFKIRKSS